jgi:hypothetical protein
MSNAGGVGSTLNRYSDMLAGNATYVPLSYSSIATQTVGSGGASSITFSSIPSTYTHLQLRYNTFGTINLAAQFNGDTAAHYGMHYLDGSGSAATAGVYGPSYSSAYLCLNGNSSATTGIAGVTDVLDYTSTSKNKTFRTLVGIDLNGSGGIELNSGLWTNTSAITSMTILPDGGNPFKQYTTFALYGIK